MGQGTLEASETLEPLPPGDQERLRTIPELVAAAVLNQLRVGTFEGLPEQRRHNTYVVAGHLAAQCVEQEAQGYTLSDDLEFKMRLISDFDPSAPLQIGFYTQTTPLDIFKR